MAFAYINPNPTFAPQVLIITAITNANPCVVTTNFNHNYLTGLIVRLSIPIYAGIQQIAGQLFEITVLTANTFSIPVDTTQFDVFVTPTGAFEQLPQVIPVGEDNSILTMAVSNIT